MGTTAEKLQAILNSKEAIRQAIAAKGVEVSSDVALANYAGKIGEIEGGSTPVVEPIDPVEYRRTHRNSNWPAMALPSEMEDDLDRVLLLYDASGAYCSFGLNVTFSGDITAKAAFYNNTTKYGEETLTLTSGTVGYFQYDYSENYNYILVTIEGAKSSITDFQYLRGQYNGTSLSKNVYIPLCEVSGRTEATNISISGSSVQYFSFTGLTYTNANLKFADCHVLTAIPQLDTSKMTVMNGIFAGCRSLIAIPQLDTSNVTDMSNMFSYCYSLTTIPQLDTSNVTKMNGMFNECNSLTTIPQLNTSNVTNMSRMFYNCYSLTTIPQLNTSKVTNTGQMFYNCYSLTTIPQLDTSNVTNMNGMFGNCYSLTTIPQLDTSNVTNMNNMFGNCYSLTTIPQLDTSNVTNMNDMFRTCRCLRTIPQLDTSNVTSMNRMFSECNSLTSIPQLNTSNVTNMGYMLQFCYSLTTIPQLDTSNVTTMTSMFAYSSSLTTIPQLNTIKVTAMSSMFDYCDSLISMNATNMSVGFSLSQSTLLDADALVNIFNNLATITTSKTITIGSTNKAKLTEDQLAIATNKGWTVA